MSRGKDPSAPGSNWQDQSPLPGPTSAPASQALMARVALRSLQEHSCPSPSEPPRPQGAADGETGPQQGPRWVPMWPSRCLPPGPGGLLGGPWFLGRAGPAVWTPERPGPPRGTAGVPAPGGWREPAARAPDSAGFSQSPLGLGVSFFCVSYLFSKPKAEFRCALSAP